MPDRNRSGFTLVELLVVVVIIAMLVGLLLPAVINARGRARQTQCSNNQHELGLAVQQYEAAKGHLPGYINSFGPINRSSRAIPLSWPVVLFEYLGREDLWREWRVGNRPTVDMPVMVCPSDTTGQDGLSYVANCGLIDPLVNPASPPDPRTPPDRATCGVFHDRFYYDGPDVNSERMADGASQTLLFSENIQAVNWPDRTEAEIGMVWSGDANAPGTCGNTSQLPVAINQCKEEVAAAPPDDVIYARPSSYHVDGVVVTYCDGHQEFLLDDIDYEVYQRKMIPDDAAARRAGLIP